MTVMTRIGRIRIRIKAPEPIRIEAPVPNAPFIMLTPRASWDDAEVFAVAPDGSELSLPAKSVSFQISEGYEPATATIVVYADEIDVEALAKITDVEGPRPSFSLPSTRTPQPK